MPFNSAEFNASQFNSPGTEVSVRQSPRRTNIFQPKRCDIIRPTSVQTGAVVEELFDYVAAGEPFDIQARSGAILSHDYGRVIVHRMVGYCDTAADVKVRDRIIDGLDIYRVTNINVKGFRLHIDLELVSAL